MRFFKRRIPTVELPAEVYDAILEKLDEDAITADGIEVRIIRGPQQIPDAIARHMARRLSCK